VFGFTTFGLINPAIPAALKGGGGEIWSGDLNSMISEFNRQVVAFQLSILAAGFRPDLGDAADARTKAALGSCISCYLKSGGVPVPFTIELDTGVTLTPASTLKTLYDELRLAVSANRIGDLTELTWLLYDLNSSNLLFGACIPLAL
jgi:hypothetical protein